MCEEIYNIDELISRLIQLRNEIDENGEIYIVQDNGEYVRIKNIYSDIDNDIIIMVDE